MIPPPAQEDAGEGARAPLRRHFVCPGRPVAEAGGDDGEAHDGGDVVVGGDAVVPLESAAEAAVDEDLLAVGPGEDADRGHARAAVAGSVAGCAPVDVKRMQAPGAVVAVATAEPERPGVHAAMTATESITMSCHAALSSPRFQPVLRAVFEGARHVLWPFARTEVRW